jgi:hypothetical protein
MGKGGGSRDLAKEKFWRQMLARQKASGKTQKKFCHDEDINHHNFQSWKQVIRSRDNFERKHANKAAEGYEPLEQFVRIVVPDEPAQAVAENIKSAFADPIAEIEYLNIKVRILRGVDSASLHAILEVMRERFS